MERILKYTVDGEQYEGTIKDYANALHHSTLESVEVSRFIVNDRGNQVQPEIEFTGFNVDDTGYATVRIIGYGEAGYVVDGWA